MGQRANLIIVENGDYVVKYDHWAANRLDDILFWGADYALEYFDAQETVGDDGWLDDVWAEGGAVLDPDKKHLLWWGGEDIIYEMPLRRVYLELQKKVWRGWTVEWAHRGIVDLAEYVGYPKEKVLASREKRPDSVVEVEMPEQKSRIHTAGSIKTAEGQIYLFPLVFDCEDYLRNGTVLVGQCKAAGGIRKLVWNDWAENETFPDGGFFIDEKNRVVEFWLRRDCPALVGQLKQRWDDWDVVWHRDKYEFQTERLGERLVLPETDKPQLIERLRENLLRDDGKSGLDSMLDTNEVLREAGFVVRLNQWLFKSHEVKKSPESKTEIWQRIFGE